MDLRLLRSFRAIVEGGSITAAAADQLISQPALSRQLQQLERQIGVPLFQREHGRLNLNAAGRAFLVSVDEVLAAADNARSLADSLAAGRLARVRMAAPTTTLTDVIAPFLATLESSDPLITVSEANFEQAIRGLRSDRDLAIVTSPPPRQIASRRVAALPLWAYVCPGHPLHTERRQVTIEQLARQPLILLHPGFRARTVIDEALAASGLSPVTVIECDHPQVAQALAAAGRGIAVLSDDPRFGLIPLRIHFDAADLTLTLHAAWNRQHHAAAELAGLAERLTKFCLERYDTA